ncbi:tannase/feruloyl esterase family alpha/beta hydrolase [Telmatospirillum sp.]|uniref:tannase/feruloyl esterase family alpha/beta hydrolase n=1 Tax=Telmatospirillum sp. TaxID=2079197 RepID=UPI0028411B00|nr:tannase/feruloyl esterase family alpha/beta hydrolase [Telmatospirillum sp.]MDR3439728.1 tannase/feruloyl esterase family alpha/beta hydrolase [Telmatospirillum sp.]
MIFHGRRRYFRPGKGVLLASVGMALVAGVATSASAQSYSAATTCASLASVALPVSSSITVAQTVSGGSFVNPDGSGTETGLPTFCRVSGFAAPTSDSHIGWEVWLPVSGWVGRYMQMGNGGLNGVMRYSYLGNSLQSNNVAAGTDGGHQSASNTDATFAMGHPEKVTDLGYRALPVTHDIAMALINAFYGLAPQHSYFVGCSDGGREGLQMAQRYPTYFDGILAGDPVNYISHMQVAGIRLGQNMSAVGGFVSSAKLAAIQAAALASCPSAQLDPTDRTVVIDPRQCSFDPGVLLCSGTETSSCLTSAEVTTVKGITQGTYNPVTGGLIFPGFFATNAAASTGWGPQWIIGATPLAGGQFGNAYGMMGNAFYSNVAWDYTRFDLNSGTASYDASAVAAVMNAINPNLSAFKAHGGKLIFYHGWEDAATSPLNTINYYNSVVRNNASTADGQVLDIAIGNPEYNSSTNPYAVPALQSVVANSALSARAKMLAAQAAQAAYARSLATTQQFAKLYMVPGMDHCSGGPGAQSFAEVRGKGELVTALENWVESGTAPDRVVISKHASNSSTGAVLYTRPLCVYPKMQHYIGSGDATSANNWVCQ